MNKRKLDLMQLFVHGKIDYRTYNTILECLNMIGE